MRVAPRNKYKNKYELKEWKFLSSSNHRKQTENLYIAVSPNERGSTSGQAKAQGEMIM
jgi:hypothetical protein